MPRLFLNLILVFLLASACGDITPDERARAQKDRGKAMMNPHQDEQHEQSPPNDLHKKRRLMHLYQ